MTPAINLLKKKKIKHVLHSYKANSTSLESYGDEAAKALGLDANRVFKTLIAELNGEKNRFGVAIVPVSSKLDLKHFAKTTGAKSAAMAKPVDAQRVTGYVLGGISPLGQKQNLPTVVDQSLTSFKTVFVSAGKRGLEIEINPLELIALTQASIDAIAK